MEVVPVMQKPTCVHLIRYHQMKVMESQVSQSMIIMLGWVAFPTNHFVDWYFSSMCFMPAFKLAVNPGITSRRCVHGDGPRDYISPPNVTLPHILT